MLQQRLLVTVWVLAMAACGSNGSHAVGDAGASDGPRPDGSGAIDASADGAIENGGTEAVDAGAEPSDAPDGANVDAPVQDAEMEASDADAAGPDGGEEAGQDASEAIEAGADATEDAGSCVEGACGTPPSCQTNGPGTSQCGSSSESCCTSLEVAGDTYYRSYASGDGGSGLTTEADPATVSGFRLDKYLVTVGRFAPFVAAWRGGWVPPAGSGKHAHLNGGEGLANGAIAGTYEPGWATTDNVQVAPTASNLDCLSGFATWGIAPDLPINCVNWFEAYAFCIWDSGFLPSEAWELAAAGGAQQLRYPWGATAPGTSNEYAIYGCNFPSGSATCAGVTNIAPVGTATLGAGLWGQLDLVGELWQWTADFSNSYATPCADCASLTTLSTGRVARGGSAFSAVSSLLPAARGVGRPADHNYDFGFRCARSP